jgi:DNA-binding NarL/FixJ family response regulator
MPIRVAVIEDNPEFLRRFVAVIEANADLALAGAASCGAAGIALIDRGRADIYLVDLGLPDMSGMDVIKHAARVRPECGVMVITVFGDDAHVIASIEAGATGYLLKDSPALEMADCIRMLHAGGSPISPIIARRILQRFRVDRAVAASGIVRPPASAFSPAGLRNASPADVGSQALTDREAGVLGALSKGLTYKEIGSQQGISAHTVAQHVKNIYRKLTVHSRGEAVYEATKRGLISL